MKRPKVYCSDCKYFAREEESYKYHPNSTITNYRMVDICRAPKNQVEYDTYKRRYVRYKRNPESINWRNKCKWYQKH